MKQVDNDIAQLLIMDMERNDILSKQIIECEELLKDIENRNTKGIYHLSFCNWLFKKLKFKFRTFETDCINGKHTDFDCDDIFMEDLKQAVLKRKNRIENHAKKFINPQYLQ